MIQITKKTIAQAIQRSLTSQRAPSGGSSFAVKVWESVVRSQYSTFYQFLRITQRLSGKPGNKL